MRIASASDDQTVQVWDAFTGGNKVVYGGHTAKVTTVAWSPDGTSIASGDLNGTVQIWNPSNGNLYLTYRFQAAATVDSHIGALQATSGGGDPGVHTVVWSPDGRYIVVAGSSIPTTVWNAGNGQNVFTYPENDQDAEFSLAWSPDSKNIALGNIDGTVRVWEPSTNKVLAYKGQSMNVYSLAWSPDGTRIASGSIDDTVQIWDASTLTTLFTYRGHTNEIRAVSWSPDSEYVASGSSDQTVQVWQAQKW